MKQLEEIAEIKKLLLKQSQLITDYITLKEHPPIFVQKTEYEQIRDSIASQQRQSLIEEIRKEVLEQPEVNTYRETRVKGTSVTHRTKSAISLDQVLALLDKLGGKEK